MPFANKLCIAADERPRRLKVEVHMNCSDLSWKCEIRPVTNHKSFRLCAGYSEHVPMLITKKEKVVKKPKRTFIYNLISIFRVPSAHM